MGFGDWSGIILVSEDVAGLCVQALVGDGATGVVFVRTCQQLLLSLIELVPASSWTDPSAMVAVTVGHLNLKRSYCRGMIAAGERIENISGEQSSTQQGQ